MQEEKKLLNEELEYAESKERRRIMGNIRFIGELFKLNMLTEQIMHNCIMSLFKARDEESLESLCKLLTTIGMGLDHVKGKVKFCFCSLLLKKLRNFSAECLLFLYRNNSSDILLVGFVY